LARGWVPWTVGANCAAAVARPDGSFPVFLGSNEGSGKIFELAEGTFSDDGNVIPASYATYFVNGSEFGLPAVGRKLFGYLRVNAEGAGTLVVAGFPIANRAVVIASVARAGNLATVTTGTPHGFYPGQAIEIEGVADGSYNGQATVLSVVSSAVFTYGNDGSDGSSSGGSVVPVLGALTLSSPASVSGNLELPVNFSGESLSFRFGISEEAMPGDWFALSQRIEVYLKTDPWAPFGTDG
jgi:hypothetical protein